jgi:hypothetical protein
MLAAEKRIAARLHVHYLKAYMLLCILAKEIRKLVAAMVEQI